MPISEAIARLRKTAQEYKAGFISDDYIKSLLPESATEIYANELNRIEEILGHEIACFREFMDLANDKLLDFTMSSSLKIGILNAEF